MRRFTQFAISLVVLAASASSFANETGRMINLSRTSPSSEESPADSFQAAVQAQRYMGFEDESEDFSSFVFNLGFNLSKRQTLSLQQAIIAFEVVDPGYSEFQFSDTSLTFKQGLPPFANLADTGFSLAAQITLPASQESQDFDIISKPALSLAVLHDWNETVSSGARVLGRYYINRYKTTPTDPGDGGGVRLRQAELSFNPTLDLHFTRKLTLTGSAEASWVRFEPLDLENTAASSAGADQRPAVRYGLGVSMSYDLYENWSFLLGYSQGDMVEKAGGLQVVAFDPYQSRAYVGTSISM